MQQQQQQQHTLLSHRPPHHDEVEEDPEDDYWGQYGDAEDDSPIEETNKGSFTLSQGFTSTANVDVADSEDEDDDNDYWGKYVEEHEDEEEAPRSSNSCSSTSHQQQAEASNLHFDHDPSSEILNLVDTFDLDLEQTHGRRQSISGSTGSETRRILACIEDTCPPLSLASGSASTYASAFDGPYRSRAMSAPVAMAVPVAIPTSMSIPGQVDPTALSILLERLISHADNEYRVKEEEEEDESTNEFALAALARP
ncbi:hypothetical protein EDD11_002765 [Mortierella claussenii]|nr:hypothetical protein EDD11_002765 [Mortierella claussenii]